MVVCIVIIDVCVYVERFLLPDQWAKDKVTYEFFLCGPVAGGINSKDDLFMQKLIDVFPVLF